VLRFLRGGECVKVPEIGGECVKVRQWGEFVKVPERGECVNAQCQLQFAAVVLLEQAPSLQMQLASP
jgi:hypothetical protein